MSNNEDNATIDEIFGSQASAASSQASISSSQVDKNEVKEWLKADSNIYPCF